MTEGEDSMFYIYAIGQHLRAAGDGDARGPGEHLAPRR